LQRKNRDYLIKVMKEEGFTVHPNEWWHYDYKDCNLYPILNLTFEELLVKVN